MTPPAPSAGAGGRRSPALGARGAGGHSPPAPSDAPGSPRAGGARRVSPGLAEGEGFPRDKSGVKRQASPLPGRTAPPISAGSLRVDWPARSPSKTLHADWLENGGRAGMDSRPASQSEGLVLECERVAAIQGREVLVGERGGEGAGTGPG